jgi:hypothetical protein
MSRHERPRDLWSVLGTVHQWIGRELRGEHGDPGRTALARFVVGTVMVLFAGSPLVATFKALLTTILVITALVVVVRIVRRLMRQ